MTFFVVLGLLVVVSGLWFIYGYINGAAVKQKVLTENEDGETYRQPALVAKMKGWTREEVFSAMPRSILRCTMLYLVVTALAFIGGGLTGEGFRQLVVDMCADELEPAVVEPVTSEEAELSHIDRLYQHYALFGDIEPLTEQVQQLNFTRLGRWAMWNGGSHQTQTFFSEAVRVRNRASDQSAMAGWLMDTWEINGYGAPPNSPHQRVRLRLLSLLALRGVWPVSDDVIEGVMHTRDSNSCRERRTTSCLYWYPGRIISFANQTLAAWRDRQPDEYRARMTDFTQRNTGIWR